MDLFDKHQMLSTINVLSRMYDPIEYRGTYRTEMMCYAHINNALKYFNHEIIVFDHNVNHGSYNIVLERIRNIIDENESREQWDFQKPRGKYPFIVFKYHGLPGQVNPNQVWSELIKKYTMPC